VFSVEITLQLRISSTPDRNRYNGHTRPRLMEADAVFLKHMKAGQRGHLGTQPEDNCEQSMIERITDS